MQFLRRFSLAIRSSGADAKFQETPGKSGGLVSMITYVCNHIGSVSRDRHGLFSF